MTREVVGEPVIVNPDPNSQAAAHRIEGEVAKGKRQAVLDLVILRGPISCSQIDEATGWKHQSVSASLNYLHNEGFVKRVGRQPNREGFVEYLYVEASDSRPALGAEPTVRAGKVNGSGVERFSPDAPVRDGPRPDDLWRCSKCGTQRPGPMAPTLDPEYGHARCAVCKKPTLHKAVR
jgi:hypothetical protein